MSILIFMSENGPLQSDNLRTILRLTCRSLLFPQMNLLKGSETLSIASKFLHLLIMTHKLRSKKPVNQIPKFVIFENPQTSECQEVLIPSSVDPVDVMRTELD